MADASHKIPQLMTADIGRLQNILNRKYVIHGLLLRRVIRQEFILE